MMKRLHYMAAGGAINFWYTTFPGFQVPGAVSRFCIAGALGQTTSWRISGQTGRTYPLIVRKVASLLLASRLV
jgi:hypothetical protein